MLTASGIVFGVEERIRAKLIAAGATSIDKAVTSEKANLDVQERNWIHYIAGGLDSRVKKAGGNLYYTSV